MKTSLRGERLGQIVCKVKIAKFYCLTCLYTNIDGTGIMKDVR
jgi:hypothetical protein